MSQYQNVLSTQLKSLRLSGIAETLEVRLRQATDERWALSELLTRLFNDEIEHRDQVSLGVRIRRAIPGALSGRRPL